MKRQIYKINQIHQKVFILLISVLFFLLVFSDYISFKDYHDLSKISNLDYINLRMNSLSLDMNLFPRNSANDILYLSKIDSVKNLIQNSPSNNGEENLLEFMKQNNAYYQIILLNENNNLVSKLENLDGEYKIDNEGEVFLEETFQSEIEKLRKEEVVVSDITLEENKKNKISTLSYATSVFNGEEKIGTLIIKADADYFLDDIRYAQREGEKVFLIGKNGEYIANENREKEFRLKEGISIFLDYPELAETSLFDMEKVIESEEYFFSFKQLTMSKGYFIEYSEDSSNVWILVFVTDKSCLKIIGFKDFLVYEIPSFLILFLIIILYFIVGRRI